MLLCFVKIFAPVDRAHRVTSRNDLFQDFRTLFFLCCSYLEIFFPYFLYFQHTNRKLLTWRTNKLLIVKHQLDRLVCHMTNKNPTFYFCTFSIPIESSRRGEQISCLSSSFNSIGKGGTWPQKIKHLIFCFFSIPIESSGRGEQISCLSSSFNSIG